MEKLLKNTEVKVFQQLIGASKKIVLTAHVRPDGDAVGSTLGLWHLLRALGHEACVILPDMAPRTLSFLPGFKEIAYYSRHKDFCKSTIESADLIICCDFNKPSRQDSMADVIQSAVCKKIMIDHHQDPDYFADLTISYPDMSSTCELVVRLIAACGYFSDLTVDGATCLLTGIITDTQNFSVNCKNADIYEILEHLLEKGCDKTYITRKAFKERSFSGLKLEAYALANRLEVIPASRASIVTLRKEDLDKFSYERGDTEGLVNKPLEVRGMICSFFLREDPDCIKVSARSINDFPVSKICEDLYGGGGHLMAAGGEFHGTLDEAVSLLRDNIYKYAGFIKGPLDKLEL